MLGITSPTGRNFAIQNNFQVNRVTKSNIAFQGSDNVELEGPNNDIFIKSNASVPPGRKTIELSTEQKQKLAQMVSKSGYKAFEAGDYETCVKILEEAISIDPTDAKVYHAKASAEKELGMYEEAIADYTKAIEIRPDSANSLRLSAITKRRYAEQIVKTDKYASENLLNSALKDYDRYIELIQASSAVDKASKIADAHSSKAQILTDLKRYEKAIEEYDISLAMYEEQFSKTPDDTKLRSKIGSTIYKKAKCMQHMIKTPYSKIVRETVEEYTKALEYIPDSAHTHFRRAQVLKKINTPAAIEDLKRAVELAPEQAQYWELLGTILTMSDDSEKREEGFECLLKSIILNSKKD